MPVTGVRAARPCMMDLQGNCQDPVRLAGSWMLSPNRASGIPTLQLFLSKTSQPSTLPRSGRTTGPSTSIKSCTGVFLTLSYSISLVCATRKCSDIRLRLWYIHDITYIVHTFLFLPPFLIKLKKKSDRKSNLPFPDGSLSTPHRLPWCQVWVMGIRGLWGAVNHMQRSSVGKSAIGSDHWQQLNGHSKIWTVDPMLSWLG